MKSHKKLFRRISSLIAAVALLTTMSVSALASSFSVVKGGGLNLRETPSLSAKVLGQYWTGTWVEVLSEENGWAKVNVGGKSGYMMSKFLNDGTSSTTKYVRTNTGIGLNLRETPSNSGTIITSYPVKTAVKVLVNGKEWTKVSVDGKEGYMATRFLASSSSGSSSGGSVTKPVDPFKATLKNINGGSIVNFRRDPGMNTKIIKQVPVGTEVTVYEKGVNWSLVEIDGQRGYVSTYFLNY